MGPVAAGICVLMSGEEGPEVNEAELMGSALDSGVSAGGGGGVPGMVPVLAGGCSGGGASEGDFKAFCSLAAADLLHRS